MGTDANPAARRGPDLPIENVSWDEITRPGGFLDRINESPVGPFRLPSETEWEKRYEIAHDYRDGCIAFGSFSRLIPSPAPINVTDMERALAFYKRLGFALINEEGWRRGQGQVSISIGENQKINIHKEESLGAQLKAQAIGAADRFSLALVPVAGGADFCVVWDGTIEEAQQHLRTSGVEAVSPLRRVTGARGPATSVYFRDPDGNLWEFLVYAR